MRYRLIDTHCHLDFSDFDHDRNEIITNSRANGVDTFILPSVARDNWAAVKKLAEDYPEIQPAYGLHPCFLDRHSVNDLQQLDQWLIEHPALAIGESGLDYRDKNVDRKLQQTLFSGQLALAEKYQLPIIIHAVKALADVITMVKEYPKVRGVLHSFSGSIEQADILYKHGFFFGVGGPVSWKNTRKVKKMVAKLPLDAIVLESDAPDQPPENYRGLRNQPDWIVDVVEEIAKLHSLSTTEVAKFTTANAQRLFKL